MDWVPRYSGVAEKDQCKLTCQSQALGYYYVLEPRVSLLPHLMCCAASVCLWHVAWAASGWGGGAGMFQAHHACVCVCVCTGG